MPSFNETTHSGFTMLNELHFYSSYYTELKRSNLYHDAPLLHSLWINPTNTTDRHFEKKHQTGIDI